MPAALNPPPIVKGDPKREREGLSHGGIGSAPSSALRLSLYSFKFFFDSLVRSRI